MSSDSQDGYYRWEFRSEDRFPQSEELVAALQTAQQALWEIDHALRNPNWFTRGERGAAMQRQLWMSRGLVAVRDALLKAKAQEGVQ